MANAIFTDYVRDVLTNAVKSIGANKQYFEEFGDKEVNNRIFTFISSKIKKCLEELGPMFEAPEENSVTESDAGNVYSMHDAVVRRGISSGHQKFMSTMANRLKQLNNNKKAEDMKKKKKTTKNSNKKTVSMLSNTDFHDYLKKKLKPAATYKGVEVKAVMPVDSCGIMGKFLKTRHCEVQLASNEMLNYRLKFGEYLRTAKTAFNELKMRDPNKRRSWCQWIEETAGISYSYVRRMIIITEMAKKYPKLRDLSITFTELFQLSNKIKAVFNENEDIAKLWQL